MNSPSKSSNIDRKTVQGFGDEWVRFDQRRLGEGERAQLFDRYFNIFPWHPCLTNSILVAAVVVGQRWLRRAFIGFIVLMPANRL